MSKRKKNGRDRKHEGGPPGVYYDMAGNSVTPAKFAQMYRSGRVRLRVRSYFGIEVITEFVGINHCGDTDKPPWIFETVVRARDSKRFYFLYSRWTSNRSDSFALNRKIGRFIKRGGFILFYLIKLWQWWGSNEQA